MAKYTAVPSARMVSSMTCCRQAERQWRRAQRRRMRSMSPMSEVSDEFTIQHAEGAIADLCGFLTVGDHHHSCTFLFRNTAE